MLPIWVVLFRGTFEVLCFLEVLLGCFHLVAVVMLPQRGKLVPAASGWSLNSGGLLFRRSTCLCLTLVGLSSINWSHPRPGGSVSKQGWSRSRCNTQLLTHFEDSFHVKRCFSYNAALLLPSRARSPSNFCVVLMMVLTSNSFAASGKFVPVNPRSPVL